MTAMGKLVLWPNFMAAIDLFASGNHIRGVENEVAISYSSGYDCGSLSRFLTFYQGREQQGQYQRSAGIFFSPSVKFMPMTIG